MRPRARDLGISIGLLPPGPLNAITDVADVRVGHSTVIWGDPPGGPRQGPARTGVTAIWPGEDLFAGPVPAGYDILNGTGEVTGLQQIHELGLIDTPILLTSTLAVGMVAHATCAYLIENDSGLLQSGDVFIPIVGECNDADLNDAYGLHVKPEHVYEALSSATSGPVVEGCVGGGTGMICYEFKGGIGTSSRVLAAEDGGYTVGVLLMCNFGRRPRLAIAGKPVGQWLPLEEPIRSGGADADPGSCIVVVATDAPLTNHQLNRIAKRAGLGLARTGSFASNGSGEIIISFSTGYRMPRAGLTYAVELVRDDAINSLFAATVEATEEAVINALCAATTTTGIGGHVVEAIPIDRLREWFRS
ncbi:MAG: P1 family peptidase [Thermomicrobiales bacterium]